jgi:hypothetical protein
MLHPQAADGALPTIQIRRRVDSQADRLVFGIVGPDVIDLSEVVVFGG